MTTSRRPTLSCLMIGACCAASLLFPSAADAQRPTRLYGIIDIDFVGDDVAFSIELTAPHAVRFYGWGRDLDETEGMAIDREGELYLFSESGVVKKVRLSEPNRAPVTVVRRSRFDFAAASSRLSDGLIELFDSRGRQLVTFDPRADSILTGRARVATELSGLARTRTQLYGSVATGENMALYVFRDGQPQPACAGRLNLPSDVEAIERFDDRTLVIARISLTETNQIMLHVERLDPDRCTVTPVATAEIDRSQIRGFFKPSVNLEELFRQARRRGQNPQVEAIAVQ